MQLGLIARLLCKSKISTEVSDLDVVELFKILRVMVENFYSGHLKITSSKSDLETWMVFREGLILEFFTVKKGYEIGDILEFIKEYPEESLIEPIKALGDILSKKDIEMKIFESDMKLNENIDYFLEKFPFQVEFCTISNLIEGVTPYLEVDLSSYNVPDKESENLTRKELLDKYRLRIPDEEFIDSILEYAGFDSEKLGQKEV